MSNYYATVNKDGSIKNLLKSNDMAVISASDVIEITEQQFKSLGKNGQSIDHVVTKNIVQGTPSISIESRLLKLESSMADIIKYFDKQSKGNTIKSN